MVSPWSLFLYLLKKYISKIKTLKKPCVIVSIQREMAKKTTKKNKTSKISKNRLVCLVLPKALLDSVKAYRKKVGFNSTSELLRAAAKRASGLKKVHQNEPKAQVSFRLPEPLYASLSRAANQTEQSVAKIIRALLENVSKLGIRPPQILSASPSAQKPKAAKKSKSVRKKVATSEKKKTARTAVKSSKDKKKIQKKDSKKRR